MGRTPLFRHLRRALDLARVANATGRPARELIELAASGVVRRGISRRELIASGAVAGAGLALGCGKLRELGSKREAKAAGPREVAVVGAGVAGLHCAYRLLQAGVPVRVFEGQKRIGGRMWSLRDHFPEGLVCELGGELVDTGHATIRGLCDEFGLVLDDFEEDDPKLARDIWYFDGRRVRDEEVVEAFRPIAARIDEAWETVTGEIVTYAEPNSGEAIDRQSIAEWLDGAGARGWFRSLLDVGYVTEYGREIDEQSAWNLLMMIDTNPDPFRIFGDSDERFHIRGGNDQVPTKLAAALGDRVETDVRLEALSQAADGSFRLALAAGGSVREVLADRVVLALPFSTLRDVRIDLTLPEVKRKAIAELGYGTNAKLMVGFSERIWRAPGGSNGSVLTDLPFQLTWESTRLQPGKAGVLVGYTGGRRGLEVANGTAEQQSELFAAALERVFPGAAERRIGEARFHWPSFPWVKGSYACYLPGQWTSIAGAEGERVGNLHFAGEHTSYDFQGFMEGGAESGARAAQEILIDLGLAAPPAPEQEEPAAAEDAAALRREVLAALA